MKATLRGVAATLLVGFGFRLALFDGPGDGEVPDEPAKPLLWWW